MRNIFSNRGVKFKVLSYLVLFSIIVIIILWIFQIIFLNRFYYATKENEIKKVAHSIEKHLDDEEFQEFTEFAQDFANKSEVNIKIVSSENFKNEIVAGVNGIEGIPGIGKNNVENNISITDPLEFISSGGYNLSIDDQLRAKAESHVAIDRSINRESAGYTLIDDTFIYSDDYGNITQKEGSTTPRKYIYIKEVDSDIAENQFIVIEGKIPPVDATTDTLKLQLKYVSILLIIIATILSMIIARKISKPIVLINKSAKDLGLNKNLEFKARGYREINELNKTLNYAVLELDKVERLRGEFIANVSHDLRTPLTLIKGYAEAIRDFPGEVHEEDLNIIIEETIRLNTLIDDIIDTSKNDSISKIVGTPFNLSQTIESVITKIDQLDFKGKYVINYEKKPKAIVVGEEKLIMRVLFNLIGNSINHIGDNKEINIRIVDLQDSLKVEVQDFGVGISKEKLNFIWDRYYKVENNYKRTEAGSGLGLSIVKNIIESHNGTYGVTSVVGEGSTFWFTLNKEKANQGKEGKVTKDDSSK